MKRLQSAGPERVLRLVFEEVLAVLALVQGKKDVQSLDLFAMGFGEQDHPGHEDDSEGHEAFQ